MLTVSPTPERGTVHLHKPDNIYKEAEWTGLLEQRGYRVVPELAGADWAVTSWAGELPQLTGRVPQVLLATIEPRPAYGRPRREEIDGTTVHTMDLSAGSFPDIWMFFIEYGWEPPVVPDWAVREGMVCMLAGNRRLTPAHGDLIPARRMLAEEGQSRGLLDLWGRGWRGKGFVVQGEHRVGDATRSFTEIKHEILQAYRFNVALENTHLPSYVTEKFWHSVRAGCVPIYLGSSWLDRLVPSGTYIDLRDYDSAGAVYDACQELPASRAYDMVQMLQQRMDELRQAHRSDIDSVVGRWLRESVQLMEGADDQSALMASAWLPPSLPEPSGPTVEADPRPPEAKRPALSFATRLRRRLPPR